MNMKIIYEKLKTAILKLRVQTERWSRSLWRIVSLSLADDRIAPLQALSVVLEDGSVSVVYASRFLSRIKIKGMRSYSFEKGKYPTPENIVSSVMLAMNEFSVGHAEIILVIPKTWTIIKTADLPLSVLDNLSSVITYELDRITPLSADRAFYDYQIISKDENHVRVMIAAVSKEILNPYMEALRGRKISLNRITISTSSFGTLSDCMRGSDHLVFAMVSEVGYEGGFLKDHQWQGSFSGGFTSKEEVARIRVVAEEINSLLNGMGNNKEKTDIVLDWPLPDAYHTKLTENIQSPVNFIGKLDLKISALNKDMLQKISYQAAGGMLEHLSPGKAKMNLLDLGRHYQARAAMSLTTILLIVLLGLSLFWVFAPLQVEEWKIETLDREIAARRDTVRKVEIAKKELQNLEKETDSIRAFKNSKPMVLHLVKEVTRILPKNTWLTRIRVTDSTVEIEGYAASATEIVPKLEVSEYFKKVEFASSTSRDTRLNADRFILKMEIEGLPGEKVKDEKKK